jgi:DNA-binding transcriptional MerR regulator
MPIPDGPDRLLSIKEVAKRTGLAPSAIRYYDQQFEEFLGVSRGNGRRRLFSAQAVERLLTVQRLLKDQGLSLRQARAALAEGDGCAPGSIPSPSLDVIQMQAEIERLREEIAALERRVRDLRDIQQRTLALVDSLARG